MQLLFETQNQLRTVGDRYINQQVTALRDDLHERRREETQQELKDLGEYAEAERERIEEFIEKFEWKAEAGDNIDIANRGQREC